MSGYPQLRLDVDALQHNIDAMARWCAEQDVVLAPHVKTTMCAQIIDRQTAAGASQLSVATVDQVAAMFRWGHNDVLVANEVVDRDGLARLRQMLAEEPSRRITLFVDSAAGVAAAAAVFGPDADRPLDVLVDVGAPHGRTGVRSEEEARALAELSASASGLRLAGVAGYEAVVGYDREAGTLDAVDAHCRRTHDVFVELAGLFETDAPVFSMGGSAFPDRVAEFAPTRDDVPGTVRVIRSGCYVTHDHGVYADVTPLPELRPALTVLAVVLSTPEPGFAVLGAGKRDLAYDSGLPRTVAASGADGASKPGVEGIVSKLYDQHAIVTESRGLEVGDVVTLGISHPCAVFDRWPEFVVTDGSGAVIDVWQTDFHRDSIRLR